MMILRKTKVCKKCNQPLLHPEQIVQGVCELLDLRIQICGLFFESVETRLNGVDRRQPFQRQFVTQTWWLSK